MSIFQMQQEASVSVTVITDGTRKDGFCDCIPTHSSWILIQAAE